MKVEGEAVSGGDGDFNGSVDDRTGRKDNAEGSDQALWAKQLAMATTNGSHRALAVITMSTT